MTRNRLFGLIAFVALAAAWNTAAQAARAGKFQTIQSQPVQPRISVAQDFGDLRVTEIMFAPVKGTAFNASDYEYLELLNWGESTLEMGGVTFSDGISLTLTSPRQLAGGDYLVIAKNPAAYLERYGELPDNEAGYDGQLNNAGERIGLEDIRGDEILSLTYSGEAAHLQLARDGGFSLVPVDPAIIPLTAANWRVSQDQYGSPGEADPEPSQITAGTVLVNEVFAHSDLPQVDFIELYNATAEYADVGGWYITDTLSEPRRFRIPFGTEIPPYGFLSYDEIELGFAFFSEGDSAYLLGANNAGILSGYTHGFDFGVTPNGLSLGRCTVAGSNGEMEEHFTLQESMSPNAPNLKPLVGPVVISEILYGPLNDNSASSFEFIELTNISTEPVPLFDPAHPENLWQINGIGTFTLTGGTEIPAGGVLVVTAGEPDQFRQQNNVPAEVEIQGPFGGTLRDGGERISLRRPDDPNLDGTLPYIEVDAVDYLSIAPWPNIGSSGFSLERALLTEFGNSWANWQASSDVGGSPGNLRFEQPPESENSRMVFVDENSNFLPVVAWKPTAYDDSCFRELALR